MAKKLKKEDIDFEIAFYNGLIQKKPDFAEAFIALGELYTNAGMFKEGLAVDEKLVQLRPNDPIALYNLACSYSLLKDIDKAYRAVKKAIKHGYSDFVHLEKDKDLNNLKEDQRFQKYITRTKDKRLTENQEDL